jgi:CRISPR/Cas system-associated protein Csx1
MTKVYLAMTHGLKRELIVIASSVEKAETELIAAFNRHVLGKFSDAKYLGDYYEGGATEITVDGKAVHGRKNKGGMPEWEES